MKLVISVPFVLLVTMLISTASAGEVSFSGDARARYIVKNKYLFGNFGGATQDYWTSRVRINVSAKADGGAYGRGRLRMERTRWGSDNFDKFPWADIAYLGVPMGQTVLEAGRVKSNLTRFFEYDQGADQARLMWDMFGSSWTAIYRIADEGSESKFAVNRNHDNDNQAFGLTALKEFDNDWLLKGHLFYRLDEREFPLDDQLSPGIPEQIEVNDGFFWSVFVDGKIGDTKLESELAFKSSDSRQTRDESGFVINRFNVTRGDGWGWYFEGRYPMGTFIPILNVGFTLGGYDADNDFGWIMIGNSNNEPLSVISQVGEEADTIWIAPSLIYNPHDKFSMRANFVYADVSAEDQSQLDYQFESLCELSGEFTYYITEGSSFTWKFGFLKPQISGLVDDNPSEEETAFGTYGRFEVKF